MTLHNEKNHVRFCHMTKPKIVFIIPSCKYTTISIFSESLKAVGRNPPEPINRVIFLFFCENQCFWLDHSGTASPILDLMFAFERYFVGLSVSYQQFFDLGSRKRATYARFSVKNPISREKTGFGFATLQRRNKCALGEIFHRKIDTSTNSL